MVSQNLSLPLCAFPALSSIPSGGNGRIKISPEISEMYILRSVQALPAMISSPYTMVVRYCRSIISWQVLEHGRSETIRLLTGRDLSESADLGLSFSHVMMTGHSRFRC